MESWREQFVYNRQVVRKVYSGRLCRLLWAYDVVVWFGTRRPRRVKSWGPEVRLTLERLKRRGRRS